MLMNMDVSFLSSNPSLKFPSPVTKSYSTYQHKSFNQCSNGGYNRGCTFFPLKCCNNGASTSSVNDEYKHLVQNADWRSFRSMLMATETATNQAPRKEASNFSNFVTKVDYYTHVNKKKKWAHILRRPETGCLLVATDKLNGVHIFEHTVILLLSMDHETGIAGVILNRRLNETEPTGLDMKLDKPCFYGGPFEEKIFLVCSQKGGEVEWRGRFEEVMEGIYYGTKEEESVEKMVRKGCVGMEDLRVFDGCIRWETKKLEEEIEDGYWKAIACSPTIMGLA